MLCLQSSQTQTQKTEISLDFYCDWMNFNWKEKKEIEIIAFLVGDRIFEPKISLEGFA